MLTQISEFIFSEDLLFSALASLEICKLLHAKSPDIWKYEWQGLGNAVCITPRFFNLDFLTFLLETAGADPGRDVRRSIRLCYISLPLQWIAFSSTPVYARLLLKHGAVIKGTNALQLAATYVRGRLGRGRLEMVRLLVEGGGGDVKKMLEPDSPQPPSFGNVFGDGQGAVYIVRRTCV